MKKGFTSAALFAAFASCTFVAAAIDPSTIPRKTTNPIIPNAYIVELDPASVGPAGNIGKRSANPHADFYEDLASRGVSNLNIRFEYDDELFFGASVTLQQQDLIHLANANGVIAIKPVTVFPPPVPQKSVALNGPDDPALATEGVNAQSVHIMTGVDKLHGQGITGKGIRIGIIDTGVNYRHPSLGGCFGSNCKVAGGYDFVGDAYNGTNTPVPDGDPNDECGGHGTHVAGIIGATPGNQFNMSGVASDATIMAYRIFGCNGATTGDVILSAIYRAYLDGNDVITMSLGGSGGWTESFASDFASRVAKTGRIVTIAAGNAGMSGVFTSYSPGTGIDVIAVGSVQNSVIQIQNAISSNGNTPIPYFSPLPLNFTESLPVFAVSKNIVLDDACNPLPYSTPDLSGFVVLIRRGTCPFASKLANVATKGARVALIYNNGGSMTEIEGGIPSALISAEDGASLLQQFNAGKPPKISFPQSGGAGSIPSPTGGLVSTFSSYGPTFDAYLKPAISAPGGGIISTFPLKMGGWAFMSGTSMSTPYIAGVGALLLAHKGRNTNVALAARDILQSTANIVPSSKDDGALYQTASQQGAGLVGAYKALTYTTVVAPAQLLLNDTAHFNAKQTFIVTNGGQNAVTYTLSHTPAGTAHTINASSIQPINPVPLSADFASVSLSSTSFILKPGERKEVTATFTAPTFTDHTIPVYSGWIGVTGQETGEVLSVTYLGIAANLKEVKVIDNTDYTFGKVIPALLDAKGEFITGETSYDFKDNFPSIVYRLVFGSATLLFDLVDANFDQSSLRRRDLQTRGRVGELLGGLIGDSTDKGNGVSLSSWWPDSFSSWTGIKPAGTFSEVPIVGPLAQHDWNPRNDDSTTPGAGFNVLTLLTPAFADQTAIPNGRYRILMRALKVTGDPTNQGDFESWLSPVIDIKA